MDFKLPILGFRFSVSKIANRELRIKNILCLVSCILSLSLLIGCGEKENRHLVNARVLIQQGKYKEAQDISELKNEINVALGEKSGDPEALCPLKALEIVGSSASAGERQKAIADIISLVTSIEDQIKELEAIDEDLLTDDDKDKLERLNRKWNLSLEPAVIILKSETAWISSSGKPAIELLIESLKVSNPAIQSDIVKLLVSFKDQSFEALIAALQNESSVVREQAIIALGKIGDERAVAPITSLLDDEDPGVRFYIPVALDMIGGEQMEDSLHKALKNEKAEVRMAAVSILGRIEDETGIDPLVELLADVDSHVKTSATDALVKIGKPTVPRLIEVLENRAEDITLPPSDYVGDKIGDNYKKVLAKRAALQVSAASILGSIKHNDAVAPLLKSMGQTAPEEATEEEKSNAASVRSGATAALGAMGPAAVEPLMEILKSAAQDEDARANAASILGTIGDKRAVMPLIDALKDNQKSIRANAATSLGTLKDRRATLSLIEALKDPDVVTRANAAAALGTLKDKRSTQALIDVIMDKAEREKIRDAAITSLGTIKDTKALETLLKVLIDEYEKDGIRKTVTTALRTMENSWPSEAVIGLLKGEIVYGVLMPAKGTVRKWLKSEGDKNLLKGITPLVQISAGDEMEIKAPDSGTLVKIYVKEGEEAEANALIGLISFEDRDIEQEERSSIRSAASLALGKVKGAGALSALMRSVRKDKSAAVRKNAATALWEQDKADGRSTLIKALKGDDSGIVRSVAALGLGKGTLKGSDGVPPLINALRKDKYESTRVQAAWSLGEIKDKRSIAPLIDVIVEGRKGEPEADAVIAKVVEALDKIAGPAVDPLVAVLRNTEIDEVSRSKAAQILGLIESVNATESLIAALKDESVVVRSAAAKALGLITDRRALEPLINAIKDKNEWVTVQANAVAALGKIKDERAITPLIDALGSEITSIRSNAVVALGLLKDKRATVPLIRILENESEDDTIRANAVSSLNSIGDSSATDSLMAALKSDSLTIRQNAAVALGGLAVKDAVGSLAAIVRDMNEPVALRANAVTALGEIGDKSVIPLIRERLGDYNESDTVWSKVAGASGKLRVSPVPSWVSERAQDTWETSAMRSAAFLALTDSAEDLSILLKMLGHATKEIQSGAALALGEEDGKEAVQGLIDMLQNDGDEIVRRDSAKGLAAIADPSSEQALIKAHQSDATASVKRASAIALGNIKGKDGIAALMDTLNDTSKGRALRWDSAIALGTAGSEEAVPALKTALEDNLGGVHFEAAEALRKITGENYGYER